jgi:hypothetical protein
MVKAIIITILIYLLILTIIEHSNGELGWWNKRNDLYLTQYSKGGKTKVVPTKEMLTRDTTLPGPDKSEQIMINKVRDDEIAQFLLVNDGKELTPKEYSKVCGSIIRKQALAIKKTWKEHNRM